MDKSIKITKKKIELVPLTQEDIQARELALQQEVEFYNSEEQKELRYKAKVVELIRLEYSVDDEFNVRNDKDDAILGGLELPQSYIDFREYLEQCKDAAYLEVFGYERT